LIVPDSFFSCEFGFWDFFARNFAEPISLFCMNQKVALVCV